MATISTQDGIGGASTTADDVRSYNIVSPDNGGSFSFCHIFDTLPTICGKQGPLTPIRKATTVAVVDDDHEEEEIAVATSVGTVNDYDETFQEQVPEKPIEPMDPMDVTANTPNTRRSPPKIASKGPLREAPLIRKTIPIHVIG